MIKKITSFKIVCVFAGVLTLMVSVFYVYLVNGITRGTYLVKDYQAQIKALSDEKGNLEVALAKTDFWSQVEQKAEGLGFQKAQGIKYIQIGSGQVAVR